MAHPRRRYWCACLALGLVVVTAFFDRAHAVDTGGARPLQLEVLINGEKTGLLAAFLQLSDGRLASRRSELVESGLKVPGAGAPEEVVVLDELIPGKFTYDEPSQTI